METICRAYDMLKRNAKEAFSYLLTLTLSASLLLVFINIQSDANFLSQVMDVSNPALRLSGTTAIGGISLVIAVVCALNCYVANSYFLKAKSQELCVYLSCGMNIIALAKYIIIQNFILLIAALLLGVVLAFVLNPIVNLIIYQILGISGSLFTITWSGLFAWILILFFEVFYLFLLNVGFAYKAELKDLLDENERVRIPDVRVIKMPAIIYPILLVLTFVGIWFVPAKVTVFTVIIAFTFCGINGCLNHYIPAYYTKKKATYKNLGYEKIIVTGNVSVMMKQCTIYIVMLCMLVAGMSCLLADGFVLPYIQVILCISYILLLILMSASLFFKIMMEATKRKKEFYQLELLGLPQASRSTILRKEIIQLFTYIFALSLPLAIGICIRYMQSKQMEVGMAVFLIGSYVCVVSLVGFLANRYYQKSMLEKRGTEE